MPGGLFRVVREFHRRPAVDRRHLADDRDRVEIDRAVGRASDEIIGEIGAPAEADPHPAGEMPIGLLDRIRHPCASEKTSSFSRGSRPFCFHHLMISSPAAIGGALSGRKPVQSATHSGASRRNGVGAEGVRQRDQQVAAIDMAPLVEDAIGRPAQLRHRHWPAPRRPSAIHARWCRSLRDRCPSPAARSRCR